MATQSLGQWRADSLRAEPGSSAALGLYPGWSNVGVAVLVTMLVVGATNYSFGLFIKPVGADLGLGRASINVGLIMFHVGAALFSPFIGRAVDRHPARLLMLVSAALVGGGFVVIGTTSSVPLMAFCIGVPIALGTGGATMTGMVLVSRWFTRLRGRALSISALGTSFGGLVTFPLMALLIGNFGWRTALVSAGVFIWAALSLLALLLREAPIPRDVPAAETALKAVPGENREWTVAGLIRQRDFWLIAMSIALMLGVDQALLATITPYALDRGFSLTEATLLMTATTLSAIAGKLVIAWLADRTDLRLLIGATGIFGAMLCGALLFEPAYAVLITMCSLTGLAIGGTYPLSNAIVAQRFGVVSLGLARGLMLPISSVSASACLYFIGWMHDVDGSYDRGFAGFLIATLVAIGLIALTRRPPNAMEARRAPED